MLVSIGVGELCESKGLYWFLDIIGSYNTNAFKQANEFQVWKLAVDQGEDAEGCEITCEDGNGGVLVRQHVPATNYEGEDLNWWYENETTYLPSEH